MPNSRAEELALLYEAAGSLGRTLDPALIYSTLQTLAARVMDCDTLLVSLYAPEDGLIRCAYASIDGHSADPATIPTVSLKEELGMQSRVIRSGKPLIVDDAVTAMPSPELSRQHIKSLMIVPIQLESSVLGTAQVMSRRPNAYTEDHLRLLEALLIQVAAATRNAYLFQKMSAELAERSRVEADNVRLLAEAQENALRQRTFLRDVLASVTDGRLQLCDTPADLPPCPALRSPPVHLTQTDGLGRLRHEARAAAIAVGLSEERRFDLELAVGEAGMNAVVHAGSGTGQVFWDREKQTVHVRIEDQGEGIPVENLPRATLKRGYSTKATLGHGMKMILQTAGCLWLLTGPTGTIVVLEQGPLPPDAGDATGWL